MFYYYFENHFINKYFKMNINFYLKYFYIILINIKIYLFFN